MRKTKILATLGPATDDLAVLKGIIEAGVNAVRCNFSYGTLDDHRKRVEDVRRIAKELGRTVGIIADLQGPKIRVAKFKNGSVMLEDGAEFIVDADLDKDAGNNKQVGTDYKALPKDVKKGDVLLLDDGKLVFTVKEVKGNKVICHVDIGGKLSNNKGINKKDGGLTAPALTDKDKADLKVAASLNVDFVAVSFPRDAADMQEARGLLDKENSQAALVAKIERTEAVTNIDAIIQACEGIMVARGDLAVEIGDENVPGVQKHIIKRARDLDRFSITATQMMESMIENSAPTRAEVSDVANAVIDGTDAVMLSAESAAGKYPIQTVQAMAKVCVAAEEGPVMGHYFQDRMQKRASKRGDESIAMATMYTARHLDVKAILALTESGSSALWMSRIHCRIPIFALTRNVETQGLVTLYRGVEPIHFDSTRMPKDYVNRAAVDELVNRKVVKEGDLAILTSGDHMGEHGGTNKMKIVRVGSVI